MSQKETTIKSFWMIRSCWRLQISEHSSKLITNRLGRGELPGTISGNRKIFGGQLIYCFIWNLDPLIHYSFHTSI